MTRKEGITNRLSAWLSCLAILVQTIIVTGCTSPKAGAVSSATTQAQAGRIESVSKIDFDKASELKDLVEHARQFGNEMYPKVCLLLANEAAKPPRQFDLVVGPLKSRNTGETHLEARRIYINSEYLTNNPTRLEMFDKIFVHEMAHMVQQYQNKGRFLWPSRTRLNAGWEEGIADYVRYKLLGTNGQTCPECNVRFPHYSSGYTCGGAFLLYVDATCGSNIVLQLNGELYRRSYSDTFFVKATGKSLEELWTEFQKTSAFKPCAAEAFKLQQALGYADGQPPKDVETRFDKFVDQHADAITKHALKSANADGGPIRDIQKRMAIYVYFTQPGGAPEHFLSSLKHNGALPGFAKGEKGWLSTFLKYDEIVSRTYPASRTLVSGKKDDSSKYHYTVVRLSPESDWKLERAWRTAADGRVIEEFPLP